MPPRRGRFRRSAEGSRAPDSDEDVHRVDDVTRRIGEMELVLARFQRTNPPMFAATEGGEKAEAWLVQMEELFDTLEYAPRKRLKLAVLQLRDDAQRWWRGTSRCWRQWRIQIPFPGGTAEIKSCPDKRSIHSTQINKPFIGGSLIVTLLASRRLAPTSFTRKPAIQTHERILLVVVIETIPITRKTGLRRRRPAAGGYGRSAAA
ncbi:putative leucine-rich repeat receptor-like protein kinase [Dorcoceras hygrometricum]|uniref:Putative leucine-rich repeat receptor-like protein kinase n=1 Tax=Dorcoceras hygrometricum TaxID=472368 RepID=A0A2Z7B0B9_9LAMI|nr:putative leucine-rich repeat receptor-like protein kinase [Dorcoceras hygrometricum]